MTDLDNFRRDLAGFMRAAAADRRRLAAGSRVSGEDLKITALFDRLAQEAESLDDGVYRACQRDAGPDPLGRYLRRHAGDLLPQVGTLVWPRTIEDLVGWMTAQVVAARAEEGGRSRPSDGGATEARSEGSPRPSTAREPALPFAGAAEFATCFSVVAPLLSVWEIRVALDQSADRALLAAHPAVLAQVMSADTLTEGRGASTTDVVLQFRPAPAMAPCQVTMRSVSPPLAVETGQSLLVVPRSLDCEAPLLRARIGDPLQSFALAAFLLIGGLACLRFWRLRDRPHAHRPVQPALS